MEQDVYKWLLFPHLGSHFLFVIPVAHVRSFHDDACLRAVRNSRLPPQLKMELQFSRSPRASLVSWWFPER